MMEGGPTCLILSDPDLHWYWDDYCYVPVPTDANADKIYYPGISEDHSAVKSSVPGYYESNRYNTERLQTNKSEAFPYKFLQADKFGLLRQSINKF